MLCVHNIWYVACGLLLFCVAYMNRMNYDVRVIVLMFSISCILDRMNIIKFIHSKCLPRSSVRYFRFQMLGLLEFYVYR